ncbi:hypothetical protein [Streptomyces niveus]|uniref:hypothetical protein n=1 Tax=Streptomyces niveus TaxID=193462 RepID=UPI0038631E76
MPQPNDYVYWDGYNYQRVPAVGPRDSVAANAAMYGMPSWAPAQETPQQAEARWRQQQQLQQAQALQYAQAQAQARQQQQQAQAQADAMAYQRYQAENQGRVQAWLRDVPTGEPPAPPRVASSSEGARTYRPPGEPGRSGGHGRRGKGQGRRS